MIYLVSYDLKSPGRDYSSLYERIKNVGTAWAHPMDSLWFIQTSQYGAQNIYEQLKDSLDANDWILVADLSSDHFGWLNNEIWRWVSSHS